MRFIYLLILFTSCTKSYVQLTDEIDPDIVLVNIEDGDRAFIGELLLAIDSCQPKLIGIDSWFVQEKEKELDSVLSHALKIIDNDILAYTLDSLQKPRKSHDKFRVNVSAEGLAVVDIRNGLSSHITPLNLIDGETCELFALKIVEWWMPDFEHGFADNRTIPIKFSRTLDQYIHYNGSEITYAEHQSKLQDKIVLLGYIGPSSEDMHFTPIRSKIEYAQHEPDTYGVVVIANEIRTIIEHSE